MESHFCAAAVSCRMAFIILDYCCQIFNIEPIEGLHTPWGSGVNDDDDFLYNSSDQSSLNQTSISSVFNETLDASTIMEDDVNPNLAHASLGRVERTRKEFQNHPLFPHIDEYREMLGDLDDDYSNTSASDYPSDCSEFNDSFKTAHNSAAENTQEF